MPTPQERADVLARLARNEVVGLRHASNQEKYERELVDAFYRFVLVCKVDRGKADGMFSNMLKLLCDARLTINFKAPHWFYDENKYQSYANFHERGTTGASADMNARDAVEMQFGRYGQQGIPNVKGGQPNPAWVAQQRIASYGVKSSPDFRAALRPRYAAVDFGFFKNGAAAKYGNSFLVVKEHMKHNATYVHRDSFGVNNDLFGRKEEYDNVVKTLDDVTATYFELGKIILYSEPDMLIQIYKYASGQKAKGSEMNPFGGQLYIEAHLHADIQFKRDLESVVISRAEMQAGSSPHPRANASWPNKKTNWDNSDANRVEKNAKLFGSANGVKVQFL